MEVIESEIAKATVLFSWPYKFYSTQHIERDYNATHNRADVDIVFDDIESIFHLTCKYEDIEFHSEQFDLFINAYIERELGKTSVDFTSQDPPQVQPLWTSVNRKKYYDRAREEDGNGEEEDFNPLISTEHFKEMIPYSHHVAKERNGSINFKLFDMIAENNQCSLTWTEDGLRVLSQDRSKIQLTVNHVAPLIALLEGVSINIYWVDALANLNFRFMKLARAADHSLYKLKKFATAYYDLHLVRYDPSSQQYVTLRPKELSDIEYPNTVKNPWKKQIKVQYGAEDNAPGRWMNPETLKQAPSLSFMPPERLNQIQSWMTNMDDEKTPEVQMQGSTTEHKLTEPSHERAKIWAEGKRVDKETSDQQAEQSNETDIEERLKLFSDLDLSKPRVRPTPRLKTASSGASTDNSMRSSKGKEPRPDFVSILVDSVAGLLSATKLQLYREASCVVNLGQLFTSSTGIPYEYQPSGNRTSEAFMPMDWNKLFNKEGIDPKSGEALFSQRLTSSEDDALFMSATPLKGTKNSKSPRYVFQHKAASDRTFYKISCKTISTGNIVLIEIDSDQKVTIKAQSQDVGYVNIHFPEFWWDAQITSSVWGSLLDSDQEEADRFLSTVWIGSTGDDPHQAEKFYARKETDMKILSCQRCRERIHRTTEEVDDKKATYLHINRVEELHMANIPSVSGGFCAFSTPIEQSSGTSEAVHDQEQRIWYEASIHSEGINSKLLDPLNLMPYSKSTETGEVFIAPEDNQDLKQFLRGEIARLFNATHGLVTEWNFIGSRDRAKAPVQVKEDSRITGGSGTRREGSSAGAMATRSRGRSEV